jgi:hypothetical protein
VLIEETKKRQPGGKPVSVATGGWLTYLNARLEQPILCKCAHCSFEIRAPLEQARQAFTEHQCSRPGPTVSKRRAKGGSNWGSLARARGAA